MIAAVVYFSELKNINRPSEQNHIHSTKKRYCHAVPQCEELLNVQKKQKYVSELTNTRLIAHIERFLDAGHKSFALNPSELGQLYIKAKISAKQLRVNASNGENAALNATTVEIFAFVDEQITINSASLKTSDGNKLKEVLHQLRAVVTN